MTRRLVSTGRYRVGPLPELPMNAPDACELTRAAKLLATAAAEKRRGVRAAYVRAHCAALHADMTRNPVRAIPSVRFGVN